MIHHAHVKFTWGYLSNESDFKGIMSRAILSLILFVAGILHIAMPWLFDPAIPFEFKWIINMSAGILEISLSLSLFIKKIQDFSARMAALWFLCLIPVHIYVSWNQIAIFGI